MALRMPHVIAVRGRGRRIWRATRTARLWRRRRRPRLSCSARRAPAAGRRPCRRARAAARASLVRARLARELRRRQRLAQRELSATSQSSTSRYLLGETRAMPPGQRPTAARRPGRNRAVACPSTRSHQRQTPARRGLDGERRRSTSRSSPGARRSSSYSGRPHRVGLAAGSSRGYSAMFRTLRSNCSKSANRGSAGSRGCSTAAPPRPVPVAEWLPQVDRDLGIARDARLGVNAGCPSGCRARVAHDVMPRQNVAPSSARGPDGVEVDARNRVPALYASGTAASTSASVPCGGHQNSSASALMTQSALVIGGGEPGHLRHPRPLVVPRRLGVGRSRGPRRALVAGEDLGRRVARPVVHSEDEVDALGEVVVEVASRMSSSSRTSSVMTSGMRRTLRPHPSADRRHVRAGHRRRRRLEVVPAAA